MEELRKKNKELKALYKETLRELNALENRLENNLENNLETTNVRSVQELWFDCRESSISGAGRGVFVKRSFKKGDIVMSSPILRFPMTDLNEGAVIKQYNGNIGDGTGFLCFDWQGLVNTTSSDKCNVRATWRIKDEYSEYIAIKDIEIGEELFQSYGEPLRIN